MRRLHMIPFKVKITKPDRNLSERLRAEYPGILRWAIDGCLIWQRMDLDLTPPAAVLSLTEEYLADQDPISQWFATFCAANPKGWTGSGELIQSANAFLPDGEGVTDRELKSKLEALGCRYERRMGGRGFRGVALIREFEFKAS